MNKKIRILIVDDHFIVRIGLVTSIETDPAFEVAAETGTGTQALELYRQHRPDVVLMDLRLPDLNGINATAALCREFPDAKVIIISSFESPEEIYRAYQAGARGYLLKDVLGDELFRVIKAVAAGEKHVPDAIARSLAEHSSANELTERELEVLQLLVKGLSNREIGRLLGFSENTAKFHLKNILTKLDVSDRTEAATAAFQRGILR
jgi:two-component system NarL family response regulator